MTKQGGVNVRVYVCLRAFPFADATGIKALRQQKRVCPFVGGRELPIPIYSRDLF